MGDKNHKAVSLSEIGEVLEQVEVACTPEAVREFLAKRPGALLAIETGTHCRWVCHVAEELGHEVLVGNARKLRMIWGSSRKNDWNDAEMLARVARADRKLLAPVTLRDGDSQSLLRLVKSRDVLVRCRTAIVNQVRGFCKAEGARLGKCSSESFVRRKFDLPEAVRAVAAPLFDALEEIGRKVALYDKMISESLVRIRREESEVLMSVDGVGPVTTAAFLACVGDPATFSSARDAGPYFGLVPRQDQSGETDRQKRISKEGNEVVRRLLVTCANYIMGPFGKDCDLRRHGLKIAERGGKNARRRAKVAVARKLAVTMLSMLRNKSMYRPFATPQAVPC